jgi:hypothetical protein
VGKPRSTAASADKITKKLERGSVDPKAVMLPVFVLSTSNPGMSAAQTE